MLAAPRVWRTQMAIRARENLHKITSYLLVTIPCSFTYGIRILKDLIGFAKKMSSKLIESTLNYEHGFQERALRRSEVT